MNILYTVALLFFTISLTAQNYRSPLDIPLLLSGNCGELRNNHFHSGIDIKTQGVSGKPVYSIEDGYVSRIGVSPGGYGLAIYVDHPSTGHTSVYGHLDRYAPKIADYVKQKQYEKESFSVDLRLDKNHFPVKKGELIAYSGNSGSSGGPHVHFEIRDTKTEEVLDPLVYYKDMIADTRAPEVRGIAIYPVPGRGVVDGTSNPLRLTVSQTENGRYAPPSGSINVWGVIGFGIKTYDRMSATSNVYGVKKVSLFVDEQKIYESYTEKFSFEQTRMINTFTDFEDWRQRKSFFMRSFVEPGNELPFYKTLVNNGYVDINEQRPYDVRYELEDIYGNKTDYRFEVFGKKQSISIPSGCSLVFSWNHVNRFANQDFKLVLPKGSLYNDLCFKFSKSRSEQYFSPIFHVNQDPVPLHKASEVSIKVENDNLSNKKQYGIVALKNKKQTWLGGNYSNSFVNAKISELGIHLAVSADTVAPQITPLNSSKWLRQAAFKIKVTDDLSGVHSLRGTIDGAYVLFEHDVKSTVYTYKFDPSRITKGKTHELVVKAADAVGNESVYTFMFDY